MINETGLTDMIAPFLTLPPVAVARIGSVILIKKL